MQELQSGRDWLSAQLALRRRDEDSQSTERARRVRLVLACAVIVLIGSVVRILHWQDSHLEPGLESLTHRYLKHADQMLDGEGILFPRNFYDPTNTQLLVHPPGYSIFAATILRLFGHDSNNLVKAQIVAEGISAVIVVLIAAEFFPLTVGMLAGLLVAFSPHLAHYSLLLLPDSFSALPILIAIFLMVRAAKRPRLILIVAAGIFVGLSCWLRSNGLLLPVFIAISVWLLFKRAQRARYSLALIAASLITMSPITIRNWIVFDRFIPLSLGAGITLIEGIGDYDVEKRFDMPVTDADTKQKDIEWHNRPDYGGGLWKPDGIERDRYRFGRGVDVIRSNPVWFAGVMVRRAGFMLKHNGSASVGWPFDTANVPPVALEPSFSHQLDTSSDGEPDLIITPADLKTNGKQLAPGASILVSPDGQALEVTGDTAAFDDQLASSPIAVDKNTDYVLLLPTQLVTGRAAAKVTSTDRRISLAVEALAESEPKQKKAERDDDEDADAKTAAGATGSATGAEATMTVFEMPFATGNRDAVSLVICNNGTSPPRPVVNVGAAKLYRVGPTAQRWTSKIRPAVRGIQRNLFSTSRMLPLFIAGLALLVVSKRWRTLVILLVVPAYYLSVQSAFHTEYRYILAIHYFLFIAAGVTMYCAGALATSAVLKGVEAAKRLRRGFAL